MRCPRKGVPIKLLFRVQSDFYTDDPDVCLAVIPSEPYVYFSESRNLGYPEIPRLRPPKSMADSARDDNFFRLLRRHFVTARDDNFFRLLRRHFVTPRDDNFFRLLRRPPKKPQTSRNDRLLFLSLFLIFLSISASAEPIKNEDCLACHDNFPIAKFKMSSHGTNLCASCHQDIKEIPHPDKVAPVNCASCHRIEAEIYNGSDHGKALASGVPAASCINCHSDSHTILSARDPNSPTYRLNIPKTCAACHENQERMEKYGLLEKHPLKSYSATVHGKALL